MAGEATGKDSLSFWESVSKTDPSATKTSNRDGRDQTSINGYWMIKQATEKFGMVGIGWGWDVLEERWDDGAMISIKVDESTTRLEQSKTHTIKLKLWFFFDGKRGEIIQYGHTPAIYKSKWGASDDSEAPKKSLMDAIKKSLSMLGFCSDIFNGMFDDKEYIAQLKTEEAIAKAEDKAAEIDARKAETVAYIVRNIEAIKNASSTSEVNGIAKVSLRHLEAQKAIQVISSICEDGITKIARLATEQKTKLEQKQ